MTDEQAALVERLKRQVPTIHLDGSGGLRPINPDGFEAAATITALQARVDALEVVVDDLADAAAEFGRPVHALTEAIAKARATLGEPK